MVMKGKTRQTKYAKAISSMGRKVMGGAYDKMEGAAKKIRKAMPDPTSPTEAKKTKEALKMNIGGKALLGTLSPAYGMATGEGAFGDAAMGLISPALKKARGRKDARAIREEAKQNPRNVPVQPGVATAPRSMKEGGKVKK